MAKAADKKETKRFTTPPFRASFLNLWKPRKFDEASEGAAKYGVTAIFDPRKFTPAEKALWLKIIGEVKERVRTDLKVEWPKGIGGNFRGIHDAAQKADLEGYEEGMRYANLSTTIKPGVVDIDKTDISPEDGNAELIYPGCYCRATVNVYTYGPHTKSKSKGVSLSLFNVQKLKDGPRLDNRVAAADDFDEDLDAEWLDGGDAGGDDEDFG